jgi:hypothetical protein
MTLGGDRTVLTNATNLKTKSPALFRGRAFRCRSVSSHLPHFAVEVLHELAHGLVGGLGEERAQLGEINGADSGRDALVGLAHGVVKPHVLAVPVEALDQADAPSPRIARPMVVLPEPDSPTNPRVVPAGMSKLTRSTTRVGWRSLRDRYSTVSSWTVFVSTLCRPSSSTVFSTTRRPNARSMRFETLDYAWDPDNPLTGKDPTIHDLSVHQQCS